MSDATSGPVSRPSGARGRWTSFLAELGDERVRRLHEAGCQQHRVRVEHDRHTLLVHLSGESGVGWTTFAVDRASRAWAVAQREVQIDAATAAYEALYGVSDC